MGNNGIKDTRKFFQHLFLYNKNLPCSFLSYITSIQCTDKAVEELTFKAYWLRDIPPV